MRLKTKLGVQLLNRTTRRIGLTHEGARFFARCKRILAALDDAESEHSTSSLRRRLRISTPALGARLLLPLVPEFRRRFPDIERDIDFSDRVVEVTQEGYDAVIRTGRLADSQLLARPLAHLWPARGRLACLFRGTRRACDACRSRRSCMHCFRSPANGRVELWRFANDEHSPSSHMRAHVQRYRSGAGGLHIPA